MHLAVVLKVLGTINCPSARLSTGHIHTDRHKLKFQSSSKRKSVLIINQVSVPVFQLKHCLISKERHRMFERHSIPEAASKTCSHSTILIARYHLLQKSLKIPPMFWLYERRFSAEAKGQKQNSTLYTKETWRGDTEAILINTCSWTY